MYHSKFMDDLIEKQKELLYSDQAMARFLRITTAEYRLYKNGNRHPSPDFVISVLKEFGTEAFL